MQSAIVELLEMPDDEKQERGLHSTPLEIYRQPETWRSTFERFGQRANALSAFLREFGFHFDQREQPAVLLVGAGTSDYIGRAVAPVLRRHWGCSVTAVPSTSLLTNAEDYILPGKKYLLVSFSRSGNSSEGVAVLEQLSDIYKDRVRNLVFTCNDRGRMGRFPGAFTVVLDERVNDKGLAMTSSFTNMVIAGQCMANLNALDAFKRTVDILIEAGDRLMPAASDVARELAKRQFGRICFLGSGVLHPIAEESALKVLELNAGKIPTLAQSHLGLRHGPLSFVNRDTLVVSYLSSGQPRVSYDLDLLEEIRRKDLCGEMAMVAPRSGKRLSSLSKHVLTLDVPESFPDDYLPAADIFLGQLLGLFTSIENKITPDSPSTGAISRVVSHVKIYPPAGDPTLAESRRS